MALEDLLPRIDDVKYVPRTLQLTLPNELLSHLSDSAYAFIVTVYEKEEEFTLLDFMEPSWQADPGSLDLFHACDEDVRLEILAFLTVFVHEYTHRIDFLISPFGLQFYVNTLREYWLFQEFFPRFLDDPKTLDSLRFLVALDEKRLSKSEDLRQLWGPLREIVHVFSGCVPPFTHAAAQAFEGLAL